MARWLVALAFLAAALRMLFMLLPELNTAEFFQGAGAVVLVFGAGAAVFFFSLGWAARADKTAQDAIRGAEEKRVKDRAWNPFA